MMRDQELSKQLSGFADGVPSLTVAGKKHCNRISCVSWNGSSHYHKLSVFPC